MKKKEEKLEAIKRSVNEMNCLLHQWKSVKKSIFWNYELKVLLNKFNITNNRLSMFSLIF